MQSSTNWGSTVAGWRRNRLAVFDVDRSYVGRIMRLALLTPDIVEAIVRGEEAERVVAGAVGEGNADGLGGTAGEACPLDALVPELVSTLKL